MGVSCLLYRPVVKEKMAYFSPPPKWDCAPPLGPKTRPGQFYCAVDWCSVSRINKKHQFSMLKLEQELSKLPVSWHLAIFDFSNGYWQQSIPTYSQKFQTLATDECVNTPTCVLDEKINAVMYLEYTLAAILPHNLLLNILWWLDDMLICLVTNVYHKFALLLSFVSRNQYNLKLHPCRCIIIFTNIP